MITYPCQSFDVSPPHRGHLSSSVMCPQFLHAFGTFTTMILPFPLPDAAFRLRAVFLDPIELAERRLAHRQPDLRLPRGAFVQGDGHDSRTDLVPDPQVALRVFSDESLAFFVDVHAIVHDLRNRQQAVQRTESHESAEFKDFHDGTLDDLLEGRRKHEGDVPDALIDRAVPVEGPRFPDPLDVAREP